LHKLNYLHNDIKLENIIIGREDPQDIFLIDFGLSKRYFDENGQHIEKKQLNRFSGNLLFASLNSCRGFCKSRRDDIESAFYILVYLLNDRKLPWTDLPTNSKASIKLEEFLNVRLLKKNTRQIVKMIPKEM
jgi:serine/threonine protein kinase